MKAASFFFIISSLISTIAAVPLAQSDVDESSLLPPDFDPRDLSEEDLARLAALEGLSDEDPSLNPVDIDTSGLSETVQEELTEPPQPPVLQSNTGSLPIPPSNLGRVQAVSSEDGGIRSGQIYAQTGYDPADSASRGNCIGPNTCGGLATSHSFQGASRRKPTACKWSGFDGSTTMVVALPAEFMGPEVYDANPYCNKQITLTYGGRSVDAFVADKCRPGGCKGHNIIVSPSVMRALSPGSSLLRGISWSINPAVSRRPIQGAGSYSAATSGNRGGSRRQRSRQGSARRPNGGTSGSTASKGQDRRVGGGGTSSGVRTGSSPITVGNPPSPQGDTSASSNRMSIKKVPPTTNQRPESGSSSTNSNPGTGSSGSTTPADLGIPQVLPVLPDHPFGNSQ